MIDTEPTLDQLAVRSGQLYSLPGVAMQVLQLTRNPQVDTKALKQCIENDPAIASRILRVVNSSLFGMSREVADLGQALAMLGTKPLKLLVLGFSLPSGLFLDLESKMLVWYWRHAATVGRPCSRPLELSNRLWRIPGDEAFLAGLFHRPRHTAALPAARPTLCAVPRPRPVHLNHPPDLMPASERRAARFRSPWPPPRGSCGNGTFRRRSAKRWPGSRATAPTAWPSRRYCISAVGSLPGSSPTETAALNELLETGRNYYQHLDQHLEPLMMKVEEQVNELAEIFSLALPDGLEYRDVLAEAQRQLAQVTTQAAEDLVRGRLPEQGSVEEDWLLDEIDSLSTALATACGRPLDEEKERGAAVAVARVSAPQSPVAVATQAPARTVTQRPTAAPNLLDRLTGIVTLCRPSRRPVSLLLVQLFSGEELLKDCGPNELATVRQVLGKVCARLDYLRRPLRPAARQSSALRLVLPGA